MSVRSWMSGWRERGLLRLSPMLAWALFLGVLTHVAGFLIFRVDVRTFSSTEQRPPFVVFLDGAAMEAGTLANERAQLFDSAPLFIPTEWSAAAEAYSGLDSPAVPNFADYRPAISLERELRPQGTFGLPLVVPSVPSDLLGLRFLQPFRTFGQVASPASTAPEWASFARIRVLGVEPATAGAEWDTLLLAGFPDVAGMSRPARFTLQLSAAGLLLSKPILLESSGWESLDAWALGWLTTPETLAALPGGRLEVSLFF